MPQLLDLANETLLQVIACIHVEDIESLSSCNMDIRSLFRPVLQLHTERGKKNYSTTSFGRSHSQIRHPHPVMLLRDSLECPAI